MKVFRTSLVLWSSLGRLLVRRQVAKHLAETGVTGDAEEELDAAVLLGVAGFGIALPARVWALLLAAWRELLDVRLAEMLDGCARWSGIGRATRAQIHEPRVDKSLGT